MFLLYDFEIQVKVKSKFDDLYFNLCFELIFIHDKAVWSFALLSRYMTLKIPPFVNRRYPFPALLQLKVP